MRWYQFQLRKPKRWARRAKSDGSAVPKIKRVRLKLFRRYRWFQRVHMLLVSIAAIPALGVFADLLIMRLDLDGVPVSSLCSYLGLPSPFDLFGYWLRGSLIVMQIIVVLVVFNMAMWILGTRAGRRNAIAHRCPRCGYSLQSRTDDAQPCPECGQRISRREAVRLWARFCR